MRTYTHLDWDARHADRLSVEDWYSGQFDPLQTAIEALPKVEADAIWCDAMLFLVADWGRPNSCVTNRHFDDLRVVGRWAISLVRP